MLSVFFLIFTSLDAMVISCPRAVEHEECLMKLIEKKMEDEYKNYSLAGVGGLECHCLLDRPRLLCP